VSRDPRDFIDAYRRRAAGPTWHPLLAADEIEPGVWRMMAQYGKCYGEIRLIHIGPEVGYRAVTWSERSHERELIGYYRTLKTASERTHAAFLLSQAAPGFAPNPWPHASTTSEA